MENQIVCQVRTGGDCTFPTGWVLMASQDLRSLVVWGLYLARK
jgi:hypothetical protein